MNVCSLTPCARVSSMFSYVGESEYSFQVSPSGRLVAYGEDTNGDEAYTLYVIDAESGEYVGQPLKGVTSDIEWAGDDYLVYITMDSLHRPDKVCELFFLLLHETCPGSCTRGL